MIPCQQCSLLSPFEEEEEGINVDRFDSGRKHVNSDSHGFEQIDPQARVLNYCFQ